MKKKILFIMEKVYTQYGGCSGDICNFGRRDCCERSCERPCEKPCEETRTEFTIINNTGFVFLISSVPCTLFTKIETFTVNPGNNTFITKIPTTYIAKNITTFVPLGSFTVDGFSQYFTATLTESGTIIFTPTSGPSSITVIRVKTCCPKKCCPRSCSSSSSSCSSSSSSSSCKRPCKPVCKPHKKKCCSSSSSSSCTSSSSSCHERKPKKKSHKKDKKLVKKVEKPQKISKIGQKPPVKVTLDSKKS